jgi:lysophospholipase L1-like esterase
VSMRSPPPRSSFAACLLLLCLAPGARAVAPAVNTAAVPQPRFDPFWLAAHRLHVRTAQFGRPGVVFLGDSITAGWAVQGAVFFQAFFGPLRPANYGIPLDGTEQVLWRVQNGLFPGSRPEVVVLMVGTNNLGRNTPGEIAAAVRRIVLTIRLLSPRTRVLLLGLLPRGDLGPRHHEAGQVNRLLAGLDDGGRTVRFVNLGGLFLLPDRRVSPALLYDGVHPSPLGYLLFANALRLPLLDLLLRP